MVADKLAKVTWIVKMWARHAGSARRAAARAARTARHMSTAARNDGFTEALPSGDIVAPLFFAGVYGFSWWMAEEGRIKGLAEQVDINTDPSKNPTPNQIFHHVWPYIAGSLGTLFDSVACKFAATNDMDWLCTVALNDDTNAAVALSLLVPPAENSPAFVKAICERPGTLRRVKEIVTIYKTLPREQHDDVVVNACILAAKVAGMPELREQGLRVADFVWMIPADKAHLYTQYGIEGLAALWQEDTKAFLCSGGVLRLSELVEGSPLLPKKAESSAIIQLLAHRLVNQYAPRSAALRARERALIEILTPPRFHSRASAGSTRKGSRCSRMRPLWRRSSHVSCDSPARPSHVRPSGRLRVSCVGRLSSRSRRACGLSSSRPCAVVRRRLPHTSRATRCSTLSSTRRRCAWELRGCSGPCTVACAAMPGLGGLT